MGKAMLSGKKSHLHFCVHTYSCPVWEFPEWSKKCKCHCEKQCHVESVQKQCDVQNTEIQLSTKKYSQAHKENKGNVISYKLYKAK